MKTGRVIANEEPLLTQGILNPAYLHPTTQGSPESLNPQIAKTPKVTSPELWALQKKAGRVTVSTDVMTTLSRSLRR